MLFMSSQERVSEAEKPGRQRRVHQHQTPKVDETMRDEFIGQDYEVGYAKPPIESQFKKGASGNPSGRPKKTSDIGTELIREAHALLTIHENGKRKVIKKVQGVAKQLMKQALTGNLPAARLLIDLLRQALDKVAEEERNCPLNRPADDLTNEELLWIVRTGNREEITAEFEKHIRPELEKSLRAKLEKSIRAELRKSMRIQLRKSVVAEVEKSTRAKLEKSIRAELEKSIRAEIEASMRNGADGPKPGNRRKNGAQTDMPRATAN